MSFMDRVTNAPMHYMLDLVHNVILLPLADALTGFRSSLLRDSTLRPVVGLVNGQRYFDDFPRPNGLTLNTFNLAGHTHMQKISEVLLLTVVLLS